ncbi:DUF397 domain-containing protein [Saccharopolyspora sp. WRP15-2]|uniref:DUF397 domain-containing protein n=1 Tax=Saccharopolyspora oryzae TaxID=2997343 RepID=A0ABT4UTF9_9PSEU|nr:DUF397 domain-containing protein [Saccharopolyspora oryzae]MDA3624511.1 DUF397 domain-containing protein [Saccharopolyspora oryzae]
MSYDTGWFKSTRSSGSSNACVEVRLTGFAVAVRDSKAPDDGCIQVSHTAWRSFLASLR